MKYIKQSEHYVTVLDGYNQKFINPNFTTISKSAIMELKVNGTIDNDDIKLVEFIFLMRFATIEQLCRYASLKQIEDCKERVECLCANSVLNRFVLIDEEQYNGRLPKDIREFFCLQEGGKYLVENYGDVAIVDWKVGDNCTSSKNVGKTILGTEIYLEMLTAPYPLFVFEMRPFFVFIYNTLYGGPVYGFHLPDGTTQYLLVENIRSSDDLLSTKEKLRRYESLVTTKIWKRYYHDASECPKILFVSNNDETALELAREVYNSTHIRGCMYTTDDRVLKGLQSEGSTLAYDEENDYLTPCNYKIFHGKA